MTATAFPGSADASSQTRHRVPYDSVLDTIGWTPLIRLNRLGRGTRTPIYGKAEFFNPGGSVKDRIGMPIVEAAERSGALRPGGTIVEGTSGNTGVGLAIAAAMRGYKCIFTMPDKMSQEKVRLLKAFGAEVIVTPTAVPPDHPDNYVEAAKRVARETPNAVLANQFYNQANPDAHYATTGPSCGSRPAAASRTSWPRRAPAARSRASAATSRSATPTCRSSPPTRRARSSPGCGCRVRTRTRPTRRARPTRSRGSARTSSPARSTWRSSTTT
jgi:hypothetical protein